MSAQLVGNNRMVIDGELYEFQITGEAEVTPGPVRQIILDTLLASVDPEVGADDEQVKYHIDALSVKIMNALDARYEFVLKEKKEDSQ